MALPALLLVAAVGFATPAIAASDARAEGPVSARADCPKQPPMRAERRCPKQPPMVAPASPLI